MSYVLTLIAFAAMGVGTAFSQTTAAASADSSAHQAHQAYVTAINSNNLKTVLGMLTDDVVFMAPNDKPYVGKSAVRPWIAEYLKAYHTHWETGQSVVVRRYSIPVGASLSTITMPTENGVSRGMPGDRITRRPANKQALDEHSRDRAARSAAPGPGGRGVPVQAAQ
jgi:hypothetical protein